MSKSKLPNVGVGIMILKNNKVLLGKRHENPKKADSELHGEGTWTMPGGKLHYKEGLCEAAQREVLEETGVKINKNKLEIVSVTNDIVKDAHFVTIGFLYKKFPKEPRVMEPDEITKWKWFNLNKPPSQIYFPSKKLLDNYLKSKGKHRIPTN